LALAWILHQPGITGTIVGPRTLQHLKEMLPACDLELDPSDLAFCDTLVPPGGFVSDHLNTAGWIPQL
jgi:aryl-alcohol dehydrogenase-like predicted oxidoreductase